MTPEVCYLISSISISVTGIVVTIACCIVPRVRKEKVQKAKKESLSLYKDIQELLLIEQELTDRLKVSKQSVRKGHSVSDKCQPKHVASRITELEEQLD